MNDYISREAAQNITSEWLSGYITDGQREVLENVEVELGELPTADVVEVVRCDQCRHFEAINNDDHGWCKLISDLPCEMSVRYDDDYCSFGERAEA